MMREEQRTAQQRFVQARLDASNINILQSQALIRSGQHLISINVKVIPIAIGISFTFGIGCAQTIPIDIRNYRACTTRSD